MTEEVYIDGIPLKDYGKPSSKSFYPEFQQIENGYKVSVPLFNELELKELDYNIENNYNELIEQISKAVSRDREIIILKKVIQKQDTEINKLNNVIDRMAKRFARNFCFAPLNEKCNQSAKDFTNEMCIKCIKEYFMKEDK